MKDTAAGGIRATQGTFSSFDMFLNFAQNIDCGYTLEPPHVAVTIYVLEHSNIMFTSVNPNFTLYKSGV